MVKSNVIEFERFAVYLINLNPVVGSEINKTRPCVVISPDVINKHLNTVIIAPLTSTKRDWPTRVNIKFQDKNGQVCLDQIRVVSKQRLIKKLGKIEGAVQKKISATLIEMFVL